MPEENLIPAGWHRVEKGKTESGDKYWSPLHLAWLPITVNGDLSQKDVVGFAAVIRKKES